MFSTNPLDVLAQSVEVLKNHFSELKDEITKAFLIPTVGYFLCSFSHFLFPLQILFSLYMIYQSNFFAYKLYSLLDKNTETKTLTNEKIWGAMMAGAAVWFLIFIGSFMIIPALYFLAVFSFAPLLSLVKGLSCVDSFSQSFELSKNNTFDILMPLFICYSPIFFLGILSFLPFLSVLNCVSPLIVGFALVVQIVLMKKYEDEKTLRGQVLNI